MSLKELEQKHLWAHQTRAVKLIERYLKEYRNGTSSGSALVRFPTGTGKTGVIAVAARLLAPEGIVAVVCPSFALRDQLRDEIAASFWTTKLGVLVPKPALSVETFTPKTLRLQLTALKPGSSAVLVATAQALAYVHRHSRSDFSALAKRASLLIFDEGHREPARRWGEAARELDCPTVLFSATPYRNDYALFDIDSQFVESLSFHDALADRYIGRVKVREASFSDARTFARVLDAALKKQPPKSRAIVRCETKNSIMEVVEALTAKGYSTIGIHDRFRSKDGERFRSRVPAPGSETARVWVHQNKLLEGIDDPRFSLVAIYEGFGNARSLVQQVGRVIRNPKRKKSQSAVILLHKKQGQREYWDQYLEFERTFDPSRHDVRDLIRSAVEEQPDYRYLGGSFRARFNPYDSGFADLLRFPRSANIYELSEKWEPGNLRDEIIAEWEQGERIVLNKAHPSKDTVVVLYADARNSPILLRDYFIEDRLGFTMVHRRGRWLFYHVTGGVLSEAMARICLPLPVDKMYTLFGTKTRAVAMSMRNTDLGVHAFRRRTVHAYSLEQAATGLSDHGYFCSTVEGYHASDELPRDVRRYVGIARGRLTETSPPNHGRAAFEAWAKTKVTELEKGRKKHTLFGRFAVPVPPPKDMTPQHILLDVTDLMERASYETVKGGKDLQIDELAVPVSEGRCSIVANGVSYEVTVTYDENRKRYQLGAKDFDDAYTLTDASDRFKRGVIAHLNVEQAFRIVPGDGWKIYAHGHFVKPSTGVGESAEDGLDLLRVITEVPALANTSSEKGRVGSAGVKSGWEGNSVFGTLDRCRPWGKCPKGAARLRDVMQGFDIVVCDDMQKETADFICADTKGNRVALLHAKWKDSQKSASAFHDVCSQAVKNLELLQPFANVEPPNLSRWDELWEAHVAQGSIGKVRRVRCGGDSGAQCWAKIGPLLGRPDTQREVWIVLGKTISIGWLKAQQKKQKPTPEAVQLFYLLQSTWAAVSSIGARLRIFAS